MNKLTTTDYIKKARAIHGSRYDYSKVLYKNATDKVCIICPIHGEFYQNPHNHLSLHGCPACGLNSRAIKRTLITEDFIKKANKVHGIGTYDYSRVDYKYWNKKICIICRKHGEIWQRADFHLKGYGCYKCSWDARKFSLQTFIFKANAVHGVGTYDYSMVKIKNNMQDQVSIICKKHGIFRQRAQQHLEHGCPQCKLSKGEKVVRNWLIDNKIEYKQQHTYPDLKGAGDRLLRFDFFLPCINLLVEFDGENHFRPFRFGELKGALIKFRQIHYNDGLKNHYCAQNGIPLLRIPYKNYKNISEIMGSFFGGPITDLKHLISSEEYGQNAENLISDYLSKKARHG